MKDSRGRLLGIHWLVSAVLAVALLVMLGVAARESAAMPAADTVGIGGAACGYATIGDAIVAAADGDTIYIAPGTYNEQLGTLDKSLRLTAATADCTAADTAAEPVNHVIDGGGGASPSGGMVNIAPGRTVTLTSMSLQHTQAVDGGILYVDSGASVTLNQVRLSNGLANKGGIAYVAADAALFANGLSFFEDGTAGTAGGALYVEGLADFFNGTRIQDSHAPLGGGLAIAGSGHVILTAGVVGNFSGLNTAGSGGGVHMTDQAWLELYSRQLNPVE
jgi:hypothetical protein